MTWLLRWNTAAEERPRFAVSRGPGPATASVSEGGSGNVVAIEGYLFDRGDLEVAGAASDAALVRSAYERWQDGLFDKLRGGFALAVWDEDRRQLMVGRDGTGLHPCFYRWDRGTLLGSPSLDRLLAEPDVPRRVNRIVLAEYLIDAVSTHQTEETFYEDIRRLAPAHVLAVTRRSLTISRYWDPVPPGFSWAGDDELSAFESVLERAVARCLAAGADSISLSGGFDSISLAVLAAGQRGAASPLHALSLRFAGLPCDEGDTQIAAARALGMPQLLKSIDESLGGDTAVGAAKALAITSSSPILSVWQSVYSGLFRSAAALGVRQPLLGTGGDDMLMVDPSYAADCAARLDVPGLWRFVRAQQRLAGLSGWRGGPSILWHDAVAPQGKRWARSALGRTSPWALERVRQWRRRDSLPGWLLPGDAGMQARIHDRWATPAPSPLAPGERAYVDCLRRLPLAPQMMIERDQSHTWAAQVGFTFHYPYYDRDVVELTLRIPPDALLAGGRAKAPLRRLVAARLPALAMLAKKVDVTDIVHRLLRDGGRTVWRELGSATALAELGLVDADRVRPYMDDYFAGRHAGLRRVWRLLSTEVWLRARSDDRSWSSQRRT